MRSLTRNKDGVGFANDDEWEEVEVADAQLARDTLTSPVTLTGNQEEEEGEISNIDVEVEKAEEDDVAMEIDDVGPGDTSMPQENLAPSKKYRESKEGGGGGNL